MANIEMMSDIIARAPAALVHEPRGRKAQRAQPLEYRLVFAVCFAVFLVVITLERLVPRRLRQVSDRAASKPLLVEAMEAAHRCSSIAFQG